MFFSNTIVHFAQGTFYDWTLTCMNPALSLLMFLSLMQTQMHALKLTLSETTVLLNPQWQTLLNDVLSLFFLSNIKPTSLRHTSYSTPAHPHAMLNYKKKDSLFSVKISSLAADEQSCCRRAEEWKWGEQRTGDVWRWTCRARGQPNSGETQKQ